MKFKDIKPGDKVLVEAQPVKLPEVEKWRSPEAVRAQNAYRVLAERAIQSAGPAVLVLPAGWRVVPTPDGGLIIHGPRKDGVQANTAVYPDSINPAEQLLYLLLKGVINDLKLQDR